MKKQLTNDLLQGLLMAAVIATAMPVPDIVLAQTSDIGGSVAHIQTAELSPFTYLIAGIFYLVGALFVGAGLMALKRHGENPTQDPLGKALAKLGAGAGLIAVPLVANQVINSSALGSAAQFNSFGGLSTN